MKNLFVVFLFVFLYYFNAKATVWNVGPTRTYTVPSQLKTLIADGDIIQIDGGVYLNDYTKWTKKNLTIIGLGTIANPTVLRSNTDIPNGKGIFVFELPGISDNPTIENIVFDGAQVSNENGGNGAGIRFQSVNLTVNNCKFINCQNGILEGNGAVTTSIVTISNSEFFNNGYQLPEDADFSGYEHHIYIGASTEKFTIQNCYLHQPRGQANSIKTRAQTSFILYNYIDEETDGYGSWEINIAQGGQNIIMGNVIIQGNSGANHGIVSYDEASNLLEDFYFVNNTVINKWEGAARYFNLSPASGINTFKIINNIFASNINSIPDLFAGNIPSVLVETGNAIVPDFTTFGFVSPSLNDYNLSNAAILAIDLGNLAGSTNQNYSLVPNKFYSNYAVNLGNRAINGSKIDIGAYEFKINSLPITIKHFSGIQKQDKIVLDWEVEEMEKITGIEIEKSTDLKKFNIIGIISSTNLYVDTNVGEANLYYYRLKLSGFDGKITYSKIIGITFTQSDDISIGPNPIENKLNIYGIKSETEIEIVNMIGQIIQNNEKVYSGEQFNISNLPKGNYFLIFKDSKTKSVNQVLKINKL